MQCFGFSIKATQPKKKRAMAAGQGFFYPLRILLANIFAIVKTHLIYQNFKMAENNTCLNEYGIFIHIKYQ